MNKKTSSEPTPKGHLPHRPGGKRKQGEGSGLFPFSWETLVPRLVHPAKVAVIEALAYVGQPLSASELKRLFDERFDLSLISYHVVQLAEIGAVVKTRERQVRGAVEKFYFFPPPE